MMICDIIVLSFTVQLNNPVKTDKLTVLIKTDDCLLSEINNHPVHMY